MSETMSYGTYISLRYSNSLNANLHKIRMLLKLFVKFILFNLFNTMKNIKQTQKC